MDSWAAQLSFGAAFATLLVAVAGAVIVLLRPQLLGVRGGFRTALALGFVSLAAGAFLSGSLLLATDHPLVVALSSLGILLLGTGTLGWGEERGTRRVVWAALVLLAAAETAAVVGAETAAAAAQSVGALGLGAVLVTSARRSIPARIAVSATASLLLVVLALSVALSAVITDNVESEALNRVASRSSVERAEVLESARRDAINSAQLVGLTLAGTRRQVLEDLAEQPAASPVIDADIQLLRPVLAARGPLLYANDDRVVITVIDPAGIDRAAAQALVGSRAVEVALTGVISSQIDVVGNQVLAVGVQPVTVAVPEGRRVVGVAVATERLDDSYLEVRARSDPDVGLALVDRDRVLSSFRQTAPDADLVSVARTAMSTGGTATDVAGGSFLAGRAIAYPEGASPVVALVASTPTAIVEDTRDSLFRTLFLVALGTALLAFLAAVLIGERIGVGVRRLTAAAETIQGGDLSARGAVSSQDELGVLSAAFDSMAESIDHLTSELRQTADEEATLRNRLEAVVGGMGEAVLAVDEASRVTTFNGAAERLFDLPAAQALGRPVTEVAVVESEEGAALGPRMASPPDEPWQAAGEVVRRDGVRVPVAISAGTLRGGGGAVAGGVYVLRDMRREREAERTKAELLSNISHELRTPLVPIKGYAEMLLRRRLTRTQAQDALRAIGDSADKLDELVSRLLDVADEEGGRLSLKREPVNVGTMVRSVVNRWRTRVDDRHPITRRVARDLPEVVGDRHLLERSLDELVDNAVKYSPEGGRILLSARLSDDGGVPAVEISVDDLGIGISADQLETIFQDFSQADASATREFGGLGLGLGLVRRIAEAHDAELVCESEPGRGSRFSMLLPVGPKEQR